MANERDAIDRTAASALEQQHLSAYAYSSVAGAAIGGTGREGEKWGQPSVGRSGKQQTNPPMSLVHWISLACPSNPYLGPHPPASLQPARRVVVVGRLSAC